MKALRNVRRVGAKGFTLIELLVVVLIIGILAAIAVPQYFKVVEKGKAAEAIQWVTNVMQAQEAYLAQNGVYATALTELPVSMQSSMKNFGGVSSFATGGGGGVPPTWTAALSNTNTSGYYGAYTVEWTGPPGAWIMLGGQSSASADIMPQ